VKAIKPNDMETAASNQSYHVPVLLNETIEALNIKPDGVYVDCTFGGGGHSSAILNCLGPQGKLFVFDQDEAAAANCPNDNRLHFIQQNFKHIKKFLRVNQVAKVDGILADLGVSSHQFDEAERGFSIRFDAPLDMRMNVKQAVTAADVLASFSEHQLHKMFEKYGEVTNAKTLARLIVEKRALTPLSTIARFKEAVQSIVKGNPNKYFAQVFQALRIEVNDELGALRELLEQSIQLLNPEGRIAVITFHSIEDRIVKHFFKCNAHEEELKDDVFGTTAPKILLPVNKKPITAGTDELKKNPRSRSAKLRVAEKSNDQ
jgi:16S rRNA (cytosine1402-N4)-methyltransferase